MTDEPATDTNKALAEVPATTPGQRSKRNAGTGTALGDQWQAAGAALLAPQVLLALVITAALIFVGENDQLSKATAVTFAVLAAVFASFAGAAGWEGISKIRDTGVLVTRGKSAIRGLRLLLQNTSALERRVMCFEPRIGTLAEDPERIRQLLEELSGRIVQLAEETVNAIEEWQDILPEADIKGQIGEISRLAAHKEALTKRIDLLEDQTTKIEKDTAEEKEGTAAEIKRLRAQLSRVDSELKKKEYSFAGTAVAGLYPETFSPSDLLQIGKFGQMSIQTNLKCDKCKMAYDSKWLAGSTCPSCGGTLKKPWELEFIDLGLPGD